MWGNKEKEPTFEETFGMSKETFDERMRESAENKTKLSALETTVEGFSSLRAELDALKVPPQQQQRQEPTNFFENPDQAFGERMAPVAAVALNSQARVEEMIARSKYGKDFQLWGKEIETLLAEHPNMADKGNPKFYENVVNMVRGRHATEIEESARKGQSYFTEQPGGSGTGGANETPESKLSDAERASAKRLGMTPEEFLSNQAHVFSSYGHTKGGTLVH